MRHLLGAALAVALSACATATPVPTMRPLTQAQIDTMGPTPVVIAENNNGVEKSWFYTSSASAGAAYGLVGALVSAAMDAIINAGPSRRATKSANEAAEELTLTDLNQSLEAHLRREIPAADVTVTGVVYSDVRSEQLLLARDPIEDVVQVAVRYTLSEDASTLRIIATASYESAQTPYATPHTFSGSVPRAETEGPAYRNNFTYYSSQLEVPTLTPELRERLVASVQDSARNDAGQLPEEATDEYRGMQRELENARDDRLTKDEIAIFLTREWLQDDGALLRREVEEAHVFIARYVALDLNRTTVPSMAGSDELIETLEDQRTVRRIGQGIESGAYISSAANVTSFSTYGNVIAIASVHSDHIDAVRDAAAGQRRARR